ncbi:DUF2157 domain-containing protein [Erythrobacter sp.]|uniref:DUF2157 domain-containing protein n=1 Tax=Erythrobacter sp. TaxID=1042 RepID=UPI001425FB18|nr:DUF2157 domain-containing protein [Erythrobacter sp.]QIQ87289.1 MAG: DUF2157 domain-containing protein [Erythrobacter sp.]
MVTGRIARWHEAGLIDAETRDRLVAYEEEHSRPFALWAVFGIGALAIGLGLVSLVAANWEEVPGQVRLAVHLALIAGAFAALLLREERLAAASPWAVEALVFVTAALGLTFFGHLGQVYQTSAPLWEPLAVWLALFGPLMLATGRGWPVAAALVGGAIWCAWEYHSALGGFLVRRTEEPAWPWLALMTALPVLFAPLGAALRSRSARADFWRRVEQCGLAYTIAGASIFAALASVGAFESEPGALDPASQLVRAAVALVAGALVAAARPTLSGRMAGGIIALAGLVTAVVFGANDVTVLAAALFMALWVGIAAAALVAGWRGVFQLAVGVIVLRLIVLSFELASDLLLSGFGLILSGVLVLGIAWAAWRVSRSFAPEAEAEG